MCLFLASVFITQHAIVFTVFGKRKIVAKHVTDPTVYGKREILYISDQIILVTETDKNSQWMKQLTKCLVGLAVDCCKLAENYLVKWKEGITPQKKCF